jgi:hypothetical protein
MARLDGKFFKTKKIVEGLVSSKGSKQLCTASLQTREIL